MKEEAWKGHHVGPEPHFSEISREVALTGERFRSYIRNSEHAVNSRYAHGPANPERHPFASFHYLYYKLATVLSEEAYSWKSFIVYDVSDI